LHEHFILGLLHMDVEKSNQIKWQQQIKGLFQDACTYRKYD